MAADHSVDIVVTSPTGHFDLVVEVKRRGFLDAATDQLREYMRGVGADVGLVVDEESIRILRDTYRNDPSIQVIGEFPIGLARGLQVGSSDREFKDFVQRWLESLVAGEDVAIEPLRSALEQHVLPVIAGGDVRAAGPRAHLAAG